MRSHHTSDPPDQDEGPSKTQLKKAMHELQELGAALLELPEAQLEDIEMDDRLRNALNELRRLKTHEARRRQTQYVGKLLRDTDVEPFRLALAAWRAGQARDAREFREIERWRERLLADDSGLAAWIKAYPASDTPQFRALVTHARREQAISREAEAKGWQQGKGRAYRELFQSVRTVVQGAADAGLADLVR
jgi:ribosome-associated protein